MTLFCNSSAHGNTLCLPLRMLVICVLPVWWLIGKSTFVAGVPTCNRLQNTLVESCPAYYEQCMNEVDIPTSLTKFQDRLACYCDFEKCLMIELEIPPHCERVQTLVDVTKRELEAYEIFDPTCDGITVMNPTPNSPPPPPAPPPPLPPAELQLEFQSMSVEGSGTCRNAERQEFVACDTTYVACLKQAGMAHVINAAQSIKIDQYPKMTACLCKFSEACIAGSSCQALTRMKSSSESALLLPDGVTCENVSSMDDGGSVDLEQFFDGLSIAGITLKLPDFSELSSEWAQAPDECVVEAKSCLQPLQTCVAGYIDAPLELDTIPPTTAECYCTYLACMDGLSEDCQESYKATYNTISERLALVAYCPRPQLLLGSRPSFSGGQMNDSTSRVFGRVEVIRSFICAIVVAILLMKAHAL